MDDPYLWSVDRSWSNYRGNSDGELAPSDHTKLHLQREDTTTAMCSRWVLLNALRGDRPAGRLSEYQGTEHEGLICRRCVPGGRP
jgi:hypothetical protein